MDASSDNITLINNLTSGNITGNIYRSKKLLSQIVGTTPTNSAAFMFKPTFFIGVDPTITQGDTLDSTAQADFNTEISLLGIKSADIEVTDGAEAIFSFALSNVLFA